MLGALALVAPRSRASELAVDLALAVAAGAVRCDAPVALATVVGSEDRGATGIWIDPRFPVTLEASIDAGAVVDLVVAASASATLELRAGETVRTVAASTEPTAARVSLGEPATSLVLSARGAPVLAGNLQVRVPGGRRTVSTLPSLVVLISCDTLRADALSAYGGPNGTPHLDRLSRRGRIHTAAYSSSPWTLPSHMTLLTGLLPGEHRVNAERPLAPGFSTLAERLRDRGWESAGFATKVAWMDAKFGFGRGFAPWILAWEDAPATLDRALLWLEGAHDRPVFLFLHLYDAHSDATRRIYDAPQPFRSFFPRDEPRLQERWPASAGSRALQEENEALAAPSPARCRTPPPLAAEARELQDAYLEGVLALDHALGGFLRELDARGLGERARIILTADHGEEFVEHGQLLHGQLHDESVHVPFLVVGSGTGIDPSPTSLVDVSRLVEGATVESRPIFGYGPRGLRSVRDGRWLLFSRLGSDAFTLFDLEGDPLESTPVHWQEHEAAARLRDVDATRQRANDARHKSVAGSPPPADAATTLTEEQKAHLETIGYVAGE